MNEKEEENNFSEEYPYGDMIEPYDIWREQQME